MNTSSLYAYLTSKPAAVEDFPFGDDVLVMKVGGKMFAALNLNELPLRFNVKCDPERAIQLREEHEDILPGYHMNKKHWNTVVLNGNLPTSLVREMIDHSYALVVSSLTRKKKEELGI